MPRKRSFRWNNTIFFEIVTYCFFFVFVFLNKCHLCNWTDYRKFSQRFNSWSSFSSLELGADISLNLGSRKIWDSYLDSAGPICYLSQISNYMAICNKSNKHIYAVRKNVFTYVFSVHNIIGLLRHEQICLMRLRF